MRDAKERLLDIAESIDRIKKYTVQGRDVFDSDELVQTWIVHHLQIIGEAAARISSNFQESNQDIPWSKIIGMRNILVHNYFGIDTDVVWAVIENELPILEEKIKKILE